MPNADTKVDIEKQRLTELLLPSIVFLVLAILAVGILFRLRNKTQLVNVTLANEPEISKIGVINGTYQTDWGKWLNDNFYGHTFVVKCHNQLQYSLFRDGNGEWRLGADFEIMRSDNSLRTACGGANGTLAQETFDAYAEKVAGLQTALEEQGKDFVFILTPYKTEVYSDKLPWYDRVIFEHYVGIGLSNWEKMKLAFDRCGVHYYDLTDDMIEMRRTADFDVFPKTGHHWTQAAVASEMNTLFDNISWMTPHIRYPRVNVDGFVEGMSYTDIDVLDNENIFSGVMSDKYVLPIINYPEKSNASVYLFGTSMSGKIADALSYEGLYAFDELVYQMYFTSQMKANTDGVTRQGFQSTDTPSTLRVMNHIQNSDLIIMEQPRQEGILWTHNRFLEYVCPNIDYIYYSLGSDITRYTDDMVGVKLDGVYSLESWGRWTKDICVATLYGDRIREPASDLTLRMTMGSYAIDQEVEVAVNGTGIASLHVTPAAAEYVVTIPAELVRQQENHIELSLSEPLHSPKERGESEDVRYLGLGISSMVVEVKA